MGACRRHRAVAEAAVDEHGGETERLTKAGAGAVQSQHRRGAAAQGVACTDTLVKQIARQYIAQRVRLDTGLVTGEAAALAEHGALGGLPAFCAEKTVVRYSVKMTAQRSLPLL